MWFVTSSDSLAVWVRKEDISRCFVHLASDKGLFFSVGGRRWTFFSCGRMEGFHQNMNENKQTERKWTMIRVMREEPQINPWPIWHVPAQVTTIYGHIYSSSWVAVATQFTKSRVNDVVRAVKDAVADNKWNWTSSINNYPPQTPHPLIISYLLLWTGAHHYHSIWTHPPPLHPPTSLPHLHPDACCPLLITHNDIHLLSFFLSVCIIDTLLSIKLE